MESFDWHLAKMVNVTSNKFMSTPNADGSVTLVLSERDPQQPNWVFTQGHSAGLMSLRFARMGEQLLPVIDTEVITLN